MTRDVKMAFEPQGMVIPLQQLLPLRTVSEAVKNSSKYRRIAASLEQIGLIEPIVVYPQNGASGSKRRYLIIDGLLRYDALKSRGDTSVGCLIATDDDSFTYNHKVNQLSPIQEHFMIVKALEHGISEERIAATLNVDVVAIRKRRDLLEGICPEAIELLRDRRVAAAALREIRRAVPMRQIEMAELMIASANFSTSYAKCLLAATPLEQLLEAAPRKVIDGLRPGDIARIEREMQVIERDFMTIEESHGKHVLNLVLVAGYIRRLLDSAAVVKFLSRRYQDFFTEFEKLAEATDLGTPR